MSRTQGISAQDVLERELARDPELRRRWEETALARALAIWLIRRRAGLGLTQEALASRLGVSPDMIARWESGEYMPDLAALLKLADTLGLRLDLRIEGSAGEEITGPQAVEEITTQHGSHLRVLLSTA